ncbi:MAG: UDP-N-acetylglucosamine diphosphorylase [Clostridiales Family XIII bacterium]|jgi:bifunctional UDP-N-acetylglucosamine pyrophosphorylase/glucosamine-1-phosphate N-acetyltransferase|nr:UDP-N-acetylglucosamine diphosphorylase [Clostridiales Family XIII bacterium]
MAEFETYYDEKRETNRRINLDLADAGVRFEDIYMAFIDADTSIGAGSYIGVGVEIKSGSVIGKDCMIEKGSTVIASKIGDGSTIGQHSRIERVEIADGVNIMQSMITDSSIGAGSSVGPFAYIRPDSTIGENCRIGDFVEIKNSVIGDDTKISHLTYVGDSDVGKEVNLGCGVVFVNYNGKEKNRTKVGNGAFIGCNVNLIAPVNIEDSAYIAAGTTVTRDVPAGSLSVGRPEERNIEGWVEKRGLLKERNEDERRDIL